MIVVYIFTNDDILNFKFENLYTAFDFITTFKITSDFDIDSIEIIFKKESDF